MTLRQMHFTWSPESKASNLSGNCLFIPVVLWGALWKGGGPISWDGGRARSRISRLQAKQPHKRTLSSRTAGGTQRPSELTD